jgi:hypothetical protein
MTRKSVNTSAGERGPVGRLDVALMAQTVMIEPAGCCESCVPLRGLRLNPGVLEVAPD